MQDLHHDQEPAAVSALISLAGLLLVLLQPVLGEGERVGGLSEAGEERQTAGAEHRGPVGAVQPASHLMLIRGDRFGHGSSGYVRAPAPEGTGALNSVGYLPALAIRSTSCALDP